MLLWLVVVTGFLTEAFRFVIEPDDPFIAYSFLGGSLAAGLSKISANWNQLHEMMWIFHATITVAFFAYVPLFSSITDERLFGLRETSVCESLSIQT